MKSNTTRNATNLLINLVLLGLFVLLGTLSFQADSATSASPAGAQVELSH